MKYYLRPSTDFEGLFILSSMEKEVVCGIYKITSPSGRVYIGQSGEIKQRFKNYKCLNSCKGQTRLYNSFIKYGVDNHMFEVIEECLFEDLNCRERHWQDFYDVIGKNGLNCILQECGILKRTASEETRRKIGEKSKGRIPSKETNEKRSKSLTGQKRSQEFCEKMSTLHKGRKASEETKEKFRLHRTGKKMSDASKKRVSDANYNKEYTLLLNLDTGIYYNSVCELARALDIECKKLHYILTNPKSKIKLKNIVYV